MCVTSTPRVYLPHDPNWEEEGTPTVAKYIFWSHPLYKYFTVLIIATYWKKQYDSLEYLLDISTELQYFSLVLGRRKGGQDIYNRFIYLGH